MKRVMVGLSGGVDSAVAAARLQARGFEVIGTFIKVWHPEFLTCDWEEERLDAMRVAAHLGIPFLTCDAEQAYYQGVAEYFIEAYRSGLTPNPDVMCNRTVKFGLFWEFAKSYNIDYIATGHYAQIVFNKDTRSYELHRGVDIKKDQTYFLWTLTEEDLQHTLLPIGDSTKADIRIEAENLTLPTAHKKDSQGICFLGQVDIPEFLSHFITLETGPVHDQDGDRIGTHKGSICYTLGQRHGFTVVNEKYAGTPLYVIDIDHKRNRLTVALEPPLLQPQSSLLLERVNLRTQLETTVDCQVQVRYQQSPLAGQVVKHSDASATVTLLETTDSVAAGQSCVLYQGTHCLGGGIIS